MKKLFYLLVVTVFLGVVLSSCYQSKPCPAYNSYKHYQKEKAF